MKKILSAFLGLFSIVAFASTGVAIPLTEQFEGTVTSASFSSSFPDSIFRVGDHVRGEYRYEVRPDTGLQSLDYSLAIYAQGGTAPVFYSASFQEGAYQQSITGTYPIISASGIDNGTGGEALYSWYYDNYNVNLSGLNGDQEETVFNLVNNLGYGSFTGGNGGTGDISYTDPATGNTITDHVFFKVEYEFDPEPQPYPVGPSESPEPATFFLFLAGVAAIGGLRFVRRHPGKTIFWQGLVAS